MKREDAPDKILVWDTETTGKYVETDRILTCYAILQGIDGKKIQDWSWTINPGYPIHEKATEVHGMTNEWIQENGRADARDAIWEIYAVLVKAAERGIPIVAYNLPFDLTLLDREIIRHGEVDGVKDIVAKGTFFDPFVFDKAEDKYRKGKRKLMNVAAHYGIELDESRLHEAQYDVEVCAKLTWLMLQRKVKKPLDQMQDWLKAAKLEQANSLQAYFKKSDTLNEDGTAIVVETGFPYNEKPLW